MFNFNLKSAETSQSGINVLTFHDGYRIYSGANFSIIEWSVDWQDKDNSEI